MTNKTTILQMATIQQAVAEMHKQNTSLCAINQEGVHLLEHKFVELFKDTREYVGRRDLKHVKVKFEFSTHYFGAKFYCISNNADLFPSYPVEALADDLINKWDSKDDPNRYRVIYRDGSYVLEFILNINKDEPIIYTYDQYTSDESISLEQAIMDHMEVQHGN